MGDLFRSCVHIQSQRGSEVNWIECCPRDLVIRQMLGSNPNLTSCYWSELLEPFSDLRYFVEDVKRGPLRIPKLLIYKVDCVNPSDDKAETFRAK